MREHATVGLKNGTGLENMQKVASFDSGRPGTLLSLIYLKRLVYSMITVSSNLPASLPVLLPAFLNLGAGTSCLYGNRPTPSWRNVAFTNHHQATTPTWRGTRGYWNAAGTGGDGWQACAQGRREVRPRTGVVRAAHQRRRKGELSLSAVSRNARRWTGR